MNFKIFSPWSLGTVSSQSEECRARRRPSSSERAWPKLCQNDAIIVGVHDDVFLMHFDVTHFTLNFRQVDKIEKFKNSQKDMDSLHAKYSIRTKSVVIGDNEWGHMQAQ
jgi:hypothetical protein